MSNKTQVILFDMDGTLVDTERLALEVIRDFFKEQGHPLTESDLEPIIGRTWAEGVDMLLEKHPIEVSSRTLETEILVRFRSLIKTRVPPIPGSAGYVRAMAKVYRVAVVSGSRRVDIEHNMKALGVWDCFERVFGYEDYTHGKPSPDPYLTALKTMQMSPDNALIFEDTEVGIQAARGAGVRVVAIGMSQAAARKLGALDGIKNFQAMTLETTRGYFERL